MPTTMLPNPKDVRDLLEGLLFRDVEVGPGEPVVPTREVRAAVGVYVEDNLARTAVIAADQALVMFGGAAMGLVPAGAAKDALAEGSLPEAVWENFAEVLNVMAALLNSDDAPHARLYSCHRPDELPPADASETLREYGARLDLTVKVAGYGSGSLSIVRRV